MKDKITTIAAIKAVIALSRGRHRCRSPKMKFTHKIAINLFFKSKTMKTILVNFKTTLVGVGGILGGAAAIVNALADGWQSTDLDVIQASWPAILAGVGLLFARDGDKSSQDNGLR